MNREDVPAEAQKNRQLPNARLRARRARLRRDNHPDGSYSRSGVKRRAVQGKVQSKTRGDGALSTRQW